MRWCFLLVLIVRPYLGVPMIFNLIGHNYAISWAVIHLHIWRRTLIYKTSCISWCFVQGESWISCTFHKPGGIIMISWNIRKIILILPSYHNNYYKVKFYPIINYIYHQVFENVQEIQDFLWWNMSGNAAFL